MKSLLERSLQLYLLPGRPEEGFTLTEWHNRAFEFWKERWTHAFRAMGAPDPNLDNFLRQNCVLVVARGEQVVALHAYTIFDLSLTAHRQHSYFTKHCTAKTLAQLDERSVRRVMSMEYLCVDPEWRTSKVGVQMAAVISEIGMQYAKAQNVDAILGVARAEKGIDTLAQEFGARIFDEHPNLYNERFAVIGFFREDPKPFPRDDERHLAHALWSKRVDATTTFTFPRKKAA